MMSREREREKKKTVWFIRGSAAKWPSVPAASSQRGQAVRGAGGDGEKPGESGRDGILLPTAVGDSITFRSSVAARNRSGSAPAS